MKSLKINLLIAVEGAGTEDWWAVQPDERDCQEKVRSRRISWLWFYSFVQPQGGDHRGEEGTGAGGCSSRGEAGNIITSHHMTSHHCHQRIFLTTAYCRLTRRERRPPQVLPPLGTSRRRAGSARRPGRIWRRPGSWTWQPGGWRQRQSGGTRSDIFHQISFLLSYRLTGLTGERSNNRTTSSPPHLWNNEYLVPELKSKQKVKPTLILLYKTNNLFFTFNNVHCRELKSLDLNSLFFIFEKCNLYYH